jgi:hypothetical protein
MQLSDAVMYGISQAAGGALTEILLRHGVEALLDLFYTFDCHHERLPPLNASTTFEETFWARQQITAGEITKPGSLRSNCSTESRVLQSAASQMPMTVR